jgi:RNA recognition motif-containing protein
VDENEEKVPEEETPNFMTLEEYKALKSAVNKRNDFNVRQAGEGEDQSKWGKTYLLPKKADAEDEEESEEEEEEEEDDVSMIRINFDHELGKICRINCYGQLYSDR